MYSLLYPTVHYVTQLVTLPCDTYTIRHYSWLTHDNNFHPVRFSSERWKRLLCKLMLRVNPPMPDFKSSHWTRQLSMVTRLCLLQRSSTSFHRHWLHSFRTSQPRSCDQTILSRCQIMPRLDNWKPHCWHRAHAPPSSMAYHPGFPHRKTNHHVCTTVMTLTSRRSCMRFVVQCTQSSAIRGLAMSICSWNRLWQACGQHNKQFNMIKCFINF